MRIGFYLQAFESLGVEYLSACLKRAGHEVLVFYDPRLGNDLVFQNGLLERFCDLQDAVVEEMAAADLDLAAFSVVTDNYATALKAADKLKRLTDVPTVFGGVHVSPIPDRVLKQPCIDYVVTGEAEEAAVDLADALEAGERDFRLPNVGLKSKGEMVIEPPRPLIEDLDSIPFPDKDLFWKEVPGIWKSCYILVGSRGCSFNCTYCFNSYMKRMYEDKGCWRRWRSVDNIIDELKWAKERYDFSRVQFWDDNLLDRKDWYEPLLERYGEEIGLPMAVWASPQHLNKHTVSLLEKAGCANLSVGLQTIYESTREKILRRFQTNETIANAIDTVAESSITLEISCIVQLPGQTLQEVEDTARFLNEHRPDAAFVFFLRYFPKIDLIDIAKEMGHITEDEIDEFEEALEERAFTLPSRQDDDTIARVRLVMILSRALPKGVVRWLLDKGRYKYLPKAGLQTPLFFATDIMRRILGRKRRWQEQYTLVQYAYHVLYFAMKKIRWRLGKIGGGGAKSAAHEQDLQSNGPGA